MLLMAHVDVKEASKEELWFLDSSCSNHMCGKKELFSRLDESFSTSVITEIWTFKLQWLQNSSAEKNDEWTATISSSFEGVKTACRKTTKRSIFQKRAHGGLLRFFNWVFGCISHVHIPDSKRTKLDDKSVRCVLLGVSEDSKAYRLYDPVSQKIIVSRDVKFEEENSWDWNKSREEAIIADLDWGESDKEAVLVDTNRGNIEADHHDNTTENMEGNDSDESNEENPLNPNEGRIRRPPPWMRDYESGGLSEEEDTAYQDLFAASDPVSFGNAMESMKWRKAMDAKIEAIERNDTWELTDLPAEAKKVGVKWVYKTKLNENEKWITRLDTIRVVISLAALKEWTIYQLDVKSAFIHGELSKEVFVKQPPGYEQKGNEQKVYRLKKALNDEIMFAEFKKSMMLEFDMSDLGKMRYFLGIEVMQKSDGIFISQKKYTQEVLERFSMDKCNPVHNPMVHGFKVMKNGDGIHGLPYQTSFASSKEDTKVLERKSTSGYVFMLSLGAVSWSSKEQPVVSLSTTEVEFIAATSCACQAIWLRRIFEGLNHAQHHSTTVYCDNSSAIKLSKNLMMHGRCKHIDICFHFLHELTKDGIVEMDLETKQKISMVNKNCGLCVLDHPILILPSTFASAGSVEVSPGLTLSHPFSSKNACQLSSMPSLFSCNTFKYCFLVYTKYNNWHPISSRHEKVSLLETVGASLRFPSATARDLLPKSSVFSQECLPSAEKPSSISTSRVFMSKDILNVLNNPQEQMSLIDLSN
ncbi:Retrovirus-related Pol polyprotein from transposon TNT 1-94 [Vitis vinifera]|uniref:Retrovirus-related Pol polyprotein from transposon TNT 1-94 n=1 Tax=Vitis vinifera TaxID=29760 RepID=A0A438JWT0_VITVI|nr:Retrovirus-related Pol polyprotein from transposon TNT 1-94 [Vitis vinifera]